MLSNTGEYQDNRPIQRRDMDSKHWTCNNTTGRQLCPKTFGGRCIYIHTHKA